MHPRVCRLNDHKAHKLVLCLWHGCICSYGLDLVTCVCVCVPGGCRCVLMNAELEGEVVVPDHMCLWQVPLEGGVLTLVCGVDDNPKAGVGEGGTMCGRSWEGWMRDHGVEESELWGVGGGRSLWTAALFPLLPSPKHCLQLAMWLMGALPPGGTLAEETRDRWRASDRLSLSGIHTKTDFSSLAQNLRARHSGLAARIALASIQGGGLRRNLAALTALIRQDPVKSRQLCRELAAAHGAQREWMGVPQSRVLAAGLDLARALGEEGGEVEERVWQAVREETAAAVDPQGWEGGSTHLVPAVGVVVRVDLPVRLDLAGGWSDTPPWSLERVGRVLSLAVLLDGEAPVGAQVSVRSLPGIRVEDDEGRSHEICDPGELAATFSPEDPFCLVKAALLVTGFGGATWQKRGGAEWGLEVRTWARVPRGSGLGTSSILAAALVKALLRVRGGAGCDVSAARVSELVLLAEQRMSTGGGWQDQVGRVGGWRCSRPLPTWGSGR